MKSEQLIRQLGRVAVLLGGDSAERAVSLKSGAAVLRALETAGVDARALDPAREGLGRLLDGEFDRAFIVLHGRGGEDGTIQGALQSLGIPYTGSGVLGSALAMDKLRTKQLWCGQDLPTPAFRVVRGVQGVKEAADALGLPLVVKPSREGSSIGMSLVRDAVDLEQAVLEAAALDEQVLLEQYIVGREYTAAILDGEVLPMIRLSTPREFYDYAAKYEADTTEYLCPSDLSAAQESELASLCLQAFQAVGAKGWGRVDFMLDEQDQPCLLEVNTVPGMTDHSLVPMAAQARGMNFPELALRILSSTLAPRSEKGAGS